MDNITPYRKRKAKVMANIYLEGIDYRIAYNIVGASGGMVNSEYYSEDINFRYYDSGLHKPSTDYFDDHLGSSRVHWSVAVDDQEEDYNID